MAELTAEQQSAIDAGALLPLMEDFYTIQGEGFNTGKAAYFIRLGGCDVGCHWCDVKESWDAYLHPLTETKNIVDQELIKQLEFNDKMIKDLNVMQKKIAEKDLAILQRNIIIVVLILTIGGATYLRIKGLL
jgi:organic radical activating enzyme